MHFEVALVGPKFTALPCKAPPGSKNWQCSQPLGLVLFRFAFHPEVLFLFALPIRTPVFSCPRESSKRPVQRPWDQLVETLSKAPNKYKKVLNHHSTTSKPPKSPENHHDHLKTHLKITISRRKKHFETTKKEKEQQTSKKNSTQKKKMSFKKQQTTKMLLPRGKSLALHADRPSGFGELQ